MSIIFGAISFPDRAREEKLKAVKGRRAQVKTKKAPYSPKHGALSLRLSQGDPMMKRY
jgi:hypothetical protein